MSNKFKYTGQAMQLVILLSIATGCFIIYFIVSASLLYAKFGMNLAAMSSILQNPGNLPLLKFLQSLSSVMIFFIPAFIFSLIADTRPLEYLGINKKFTISQIIIVIAVMIACLPLIGLTGQWNEQVHLYGSLHGVEQWVRSTEKQADQQTKLLLTMHGFPQYLINMLMVAVLPGICEELFFRGVMQRIVIDWTKNITAGILITAFFFSFLHFQFLGFLPRMILGIMLGYIYVWTGSIWLAMLGHFINNGLDVTLLYFYQIGIVHTDPMKESTVPLYMGILSGIIVLALFLILKNIKINSQKANI
jgi:CAAX protease family protein